MAASRGACSRRAASSWRSSRAADPSDMSCASQNACRTRRASPKRLRIASIGPVVGPRPRCAVASCRYKSHACSAGVATPMRVAADGSPRRASAISASATRRRFISDHHGERDWRPLSICHRPWRTITSPIPRGPGSIDRARSSPPGSRSSSFATAWDVRPLGRVPGCLVQNASNCRARSSGSASAGISGARAYADTSVMHPPRRGTCPCVVARVRLTIALRAPCVAARHPRAGAASGDDQSRGSGRTCTSHPRAATSVARKARTGAPVAAVLAWCARTPRSSITASSGR